MCPSLGTELCLARAWDGGRKTKTSPNNVEFGALHSMRLKGSLSQARLKEARPLETPLRCLGDVLLRSAVVVGHRVLGAERARNEGFFKGLGISTTLQPSVVGRPVEGEALELSVEEAIPQERVRTRTMLFLCNA